MSVLLLVWSSRFSVMCALCFRMWWNWSCFPKRAPFPRVFLQSQFYPSRALSYGWWIGIDSGKIKTFPFVLDSPGNLPLYMYRYMEREREREYSRITSPSIPSALPHLSNVAYSLLVRRSCFMLLGPKLWFGFPTNMISFLGGSRWAQYNWFGAVCVAWEQTDYS